MKLFTIFVGRNIGERKKNQFFQLISSCSHINSSGFTFLSVIHVPLASEIMVYRRMVLLLSQVVSWWVLSCSVMTLTLKVFLWKNIHSSSYSYLWLKLDCCALAKSISYLNHINCDKYFSSWKIAALLQALMVCATWNVWENIHCNENRLVQQSLRDSFIYFFIILRCYLTFYFSKNRNFLLPKPLR